MEEPWVRDRLPGGAQEPEVNQPGLPAGQAV